MSRPLLSTLGLALLAACSGTEPTAGGSSYETENALARIAGKTVPGDTVVSLTQGRRAVADPQGSFRLDSLRLGVHALYGTLSKGRAYVDLATAGSSAWGVLHPEAPGEVLLEDFEDGDSRHRYGAWTGGGWWWIACDSTVTLSPSGIGMVPSKAVVADSAGGRSLHLSARFSDSGTTDWAEAGVHVDTGAADLSALRAVRFRARGSGLLTVRLIGSEGLARQNLEALVALAPDWQTYEVAVSAFQLPAWGGATVDSAGRRDKLRHCTGLAWALGSDGEFWLDDVALIGPSALGLWPGLPKP